MPNGAEPPEALVTGSGLSFAYEGSLVLEGIDLTLRRGEIVTLVGPNGAGKSTLAKVLVGVLKAKSGSLDVKAGTVVGYVPQRLNIDPTMPITVRRFMSLGSPARDRGASALADLRIGHLMDKQLRELSGGQLQRVLLARALSRKPDLLVLDEPGQGLDIESQAELSALLGAVRNQGCAVLLISHDLSLVLSCTDRVLCIDRRICCSGTPDSVVHDPDYHRILGPRAADALALYQQRSGGAEVVDLRKRADRA